MSESAAIVKLFFNSAIARNCAREYTTVTGAEERQRRDATGAPTQEPEWRAAQRVAL